MNQENQTQEDFWLLVALATDNPTEANPAKFGNVEFWKDSDGSWCYSLPATQWDSKTISSELTSTIEGLIK